MTTHNEGDFRLGTRSLGLVVEALNTHAEYLDFEDFADCDDPDEAMFEEAQRCRVLAKRINERVPGGTPIATVTFAPSNLPLHDKDLPLL